MQAGSLSDSTLDVESCRIAEGPTRARRLLIPALRGFAGAAGKPLYHQSSSIRRWLVREKVARNEMRTVRQTEKCSKTHPDQIRVEHISRQTKVLSAEGDRESSPMVYLSAEV